MENFQHVVFNPFVGENYEKEGLFGKKVLVLGESHYCTSDPECKKDCKLQCTNFTINIIKEHLEGVEDNCLRGFKSFERAVMNKELTLEERNNFWQSVIFYNFFQEPANERSEFVITEEKLENAQKAFIEIVETYMPDKIILWGKRCFGCIPDESGKAGVVCVEDGETTPSWIYTINGKEIPLMCVNHPSMPNGNSWTYWHKFHKAFLGLDF